jgi:glycosyltransferase involved in cell wall biosynthesis
MQQPVTKSNGFVSVIVPTFNRADCLGAAVDSALGQTHAELEVIICDDGSMDETPALVARRWGHEPRVRYLRQANGGVSAARNLGLRNAGGDYLAFLDSDDTWMPWKLEAQMACLAQFPDAGMIWSDMQAIGPDKEIVDPMHLRRFYDAYRWFTAQQLFSSSCPVESFMHPTPSALNGSFVRCGEIFSAMIMGNLVHTSTVLLRRDRQQVVGEFREEMRTGEDYDFHLRTCRAGPVAFLDAASIRYQLGRADRLTRAGLSWQMARNFLDTIEPVIARERDRINLPQWMIARSRANGHYWVGECALTAGRHREAVTHLAASLQLYPWQRRTAMLLAGALAPPAATHWLRLGWRQIKHALRPVH